jgi:predicted nucleic acid-binding Zn ribbon protein
MPKYDYFCATNGRTIEVNHRIGEAIRSWGELCSRAGVDAEATPASTPVQRLITASAIVSANNLGSTERPCDYGSPCGGCACSG